MLATAHGTGEEGRFKTTKKATGNLALGEGSFGGPHRLGIGIMLNKGLAGRNLWKKEKKKDTGSGQGTTGEDGAVPESPRGTEALSGSTRVPRSGPSSRLPVLAAKPTAAHVREDEDGFGQKRVSEDPRVDYLSRKAVRKWKHLVLTSLAERLAANHHKRLTLKKTLLVWHRSCKQVKLNWRQDVKAEVHHKYVMSARVWRGWTLYVQRRRESHQERQRVVQRGLEMHTRTVFWTWYNHYRHRQRLQSREVDAQAHITRLRIYRTWKHWKQRVSSAKKAMLEDQRALSHYQRHLLSGTMHEWASQLHMSYERQITEHKLKHMFRRKSCRTVLETWLCKLDERDTEKENNGKATVFYHRLLVKNVLREWRLIVAQESAARLLGLTAETHAKAHIIAPILKKWRAALHAKRKRKQRVAVSEALCRIILLRRGMRAFRQLQHQGQMEEVNHTRKVLQNIFSKWLAVTEKRQLSRELEQVKVGTIYFESRMKRMVLSAWKSFVVYEKDEKNQMRTAINHHRSRVLHKVLESLQSNAQRSRLREERKSAALEHYRRVSLARCWQVWSDMIWEKETEQKAMKRVARFREYTCLNNAFQGLKLWVRMKNEERVREQQMYQYYQNVLQHKVLQAWWTYTERSSRYFAFWQQATRFDTRKRLVGALQYWRSGLDAKRKERVKLRMATAHFERVTQSEHLQAWHIFAAEAGRFRILRMAFAQKRAAAITRPLIQRWKTRCKQAREEKLLLEEMEGEWRAKLCSRVLGAWIEYAEYRKDKRTETATLLRDAREHLVQVKLKTIFDRWKLRTWDIQAKRALDARATAFRQRALQERAVGMWRVIYKHRLWVRRKERKALAFSTRCLISRAFYAWHGTHQDEWHTLYDARHRKPVAFRDLTLTRKALKAWQIYMARKREMKAQIQAALECKKEKMLRDIAVQWLKAADQIQYPSASIPSLEHRHHYQPRRSASLPASLRLAYKYAMRWLDKTVSARQGRLSSTVRDRPATLRSQPAVLQTLPHQSIDRNARSPSRTTFQSSKFRDSTLMTSPRTIPSPTRMHYTPPRTMAPVAEISYCIAPATVTARPARAPKKPRPAPRKPAFLQDDGLENIEVTRIGPKLSIVPESIPSTYPQIAPQQVAWPLPDRADIPRPSLPFAPPPFQQPGFMPQPHNVQVLQSTSRFPLQSLPLDQAHPPFVSIRKPIDPYVAYNPFINPENSAESRWDAPQVQPLWAPVQPTLSVPPPPPSAMESAIQDAQPLKVTAVQPTSPATYHAPPQIPAASPNLSPSPLLAPIQSFAQHHLPKLVETGTTYSPPPSTPPTQPLERPERSHTPFPPAPTPPFSSREATTDQAAASTCTLPAPTTSSDLAQLAHESHLGDTGPRAREYRVRQSLEATTRLVARQAQMAARQSIASNSIKQVRSTSVRPREDQSAEQARRETVIREIRNIRSRPRADETGGREQREIMEELSRRVQELNAKKSR
ncbi:hypothetical protein DFS34DRAFT_467489 [Phlyctochytrium arcticum]|nr:hypothetical protein DFS34DRAFT_467489 [Phlyctochytrium arcticum]